MGHPGINKVFQSILKRFEWPGIKKACEKWVTACLPCQQLKDPWKLRFSLQSIESSEFNEVVEIDHQKICTTGSGYHQFLVMIHPFTKYAEAVPCINSSAEETFDHLINTWDIYLPQVMGAYNRTKHSTTGTSQHIILTGHEHPKYEGKKTSPQVYVRNKIRRQQEVNDLCRRDTQQAQSR